MVTRFDTDISRHRWDNQLKRFGDRALLRQPGRPDRWVTAAVATFTAIERMGIASNPVDLKALVSALDPDTGSPLDPEPSEKDALVTVIRDGNGNPVLDGSGQPQTDQLFKIVAPPARVGTSRTVLFWRLQVRA